MNAPRRRLFRQCRRGNRHDPLGPCHAAHGPGAKGPEELRERHCVRCLQPLRFERFGPGARSILGPHLTLAARVPSEFLSTLLDHRRIRRCTQTSRSAGKRRFVGQQHRALVSRSLTVTDRHEGIMVHARQVSGFSCVALSGGGGNAKVRLQTQEFERFLDREPHASPLSTWRMALSKFCYLPAHQTHDPRSAHSAGVLVKGGVEEGSAYRWNLSDSLRANPPALPARARPHPLRSPRSHPCLHSICARDN